MNLEFCLLYPAFRHMDPNVLECLRRGNPVVFLDISIGGSPSGRIRLELFKNICPKVRSLLVEVTV